MPRTTYRAQRAQVIEGSAVSEHRGPPIRMLWLPEPVQRVLVARRDKYPMRRSGVQLVDLILTGDRYVPNFPVVYHVLGMMPAESFDVFGHHDILGISPPVRPIEEDI